MTDSNVILPVPGLEPRPITFDEYHALTPEKLELLSGYLIAPQDRPDERLRLPVSDLVRALTQYLRIEHRTSIIVN